MMRLPFRKPTARGAAFYLHRPENLLLVKREGHGGLIVCATADNFTTTQQAAFIGYLCAEGFVSTAFEPLDGIHEQVSGWKEPPVRWLVDPAWLQVDPTYAKHLRRLCWGLAGIGVVWIVGVIALFRC